MGFYERRVLPRVLNVACGTKVVEPLRRRVCDGLAGKVVEIGFGSGLNIPFYPGAVTRVAAVEPSDLGWQLAGQRLKAASLPVQRSGLDGQSLPFEDDSYDAALSTWTLCTIPDPDAALREVRRVLKPGGTLHFLEHGLAPDENVRHWQQRLNPLQQRVFGGCNLTRPIVDLLTAAGFTIKELDVFYQKGTPKFTGADSLGTAVSPSHERGTQSWSVPRLTLSRGPPGSITAPAWIAGSDHANPAIWPVSQAMPVAEGHLARMGGAGPKAIAQVRDASPQPG
jgi:SAM-dependent methyltransferase